MNRQKLIHGSLQVSLHIDQRSAGQAVGRSGILLLASCQPYASALTSHWCVLAACLSVSGMANDLWFDVITGPFYCHHQ
jgi:hypothetical protein